MAKPSFDHPVLEPLRLRFETPAMKQLSEELHRWLWTGATGGLIYGTSRVGKSIAVQMLATQLYTRGKVKIPVYYFSLHGRDQRTITSVFRNLCYDANLRVTNRDPADHLSDRFVHYIADKAVEANCRNAILIVDEMQRLRLNQFDPFAELYDKLLLLDISLTVIFVGNDPECWTLVEQIENPKYAHIRGRFFTQGIQFLGLTSEKQVKSCLSKYDKLRYPENGPTYVEYFLPEATRKGWCLASLSGEFWRVFREYQRNYHIESWGMKFFTSATNTLLSDYLVRYGIDNFDDDIMHECIRISGLIPNLVKPAK